METKDNYYPNSYEDSRAQLRRNPPAIMSEIELAEYLGCSTRHIRNLVARRVLPFIKLGRRRLFRLGAILKTLEKLEIPSLGGR